MRRVMGLVLGLMAAGAVQAEPISSKEARKHLFGPKAVSATIVPGTLDSRQTMLMETILNGIRQNGLANYYGAIAVSPRFFEMIVSDPLPAAQSGLFQLVERHHSIEVAESVAMEACRAASQALEAAPCLIAARIMPKRYMPRAFSLSMPATLAFREYRRMRGAKAFATSRRGLGFGFAKGNGAVNAAVAACNSKLPEGGAKDCRVVVLD